MGGRADLLRGAVDLPRPAGPGRGGGPLQRRSDPANCGHGGSASAGSGPRHPDRGSGERPTEQRQGGNRRDHRSAGRILVRVGVRGGLHAGLERHLRRTRGTPDLEEASDTARPHPRHGNPSGAQRSHCRGERSAGRAGGWTTGHVECRGDGVGHHQVAGVGCAREPDVRHSLLGGAERPADQLPLGHPRRGHRRFSCG